MGWLQTIRRSLFSLGGSTYDAVHAKNKRQAPTGILRSEDSELPPTERRKLLSAKPNRSTRAKWAFLNASHPQWCGLVWKRPLQHLGCD